MNLIHNIYTIFNSFAEAEAVAAQIQNDDPDWTYAAVGDPLGSGRAVIVIKDEDGEVVGNV